MYEITILTLNFSFSLLADQCWTDIPPDSIQLLESDLPSPFK
jgi:hypothetical protein